jgi:hypothetical protein
VAGLIRAVLTTRGSKASAGAGLSSSAVIVPVSKSASLGVSRGTRTARARGVYDDRTRSDWALPYSSQADGCEDISSEVFAMQNMLGYLDHRFAQPGETRLVIGATRHEDGTWTSPASLNFHQQRGRLLHALSDIEDLSNVEFSDSVDADYPCETGIAYIDIPLGLAEFAGSLAGIVSAWVSIRPRKAVDSVPGVRLELPGRALIITGEVGEEVRRRVIEAFVQSQDRDDGDDASGSLMSDADRSVT